MKRRLRGLGCVLALAFALLAVFGASSALGATAAPGYAVSDWVTGATNSGVGPVGIAADPNSTHDIYVTNYRSGTLYKYTDTAGGVEGPAHQVSTLGIYGGNNAAGLAFDKTGRLYVALQAWGRVAEISKTDGHIIRFLASVGCATGLATDPISGDLFASNPCGGTTIRMTTAGVAIGGYGPVGMDGITFGPDGTLWGARVTPYDGAIFKINGTSAPSPGSSSIVAFVPGGDGISVAAEGGSSSLPPFIFVNGNDGKITKVDLSGPSPAYSLVTSAGSRGDLSTVGFDGCLYATQTDRVIKVTNADGSCSLAPVTPDDVTALVGLSPAAADFNDAVSVSATLKNVTQGTPLAGKAVVFTLGSGTCTGTTDSAGLATCSITIADPAGPATLTAHYAHEPTLAPATTTAPFTITLEETTLTYTGVSGGIQNGSIAALSGVLKEDGVTAIAGRTVSFALGSQSCTGTTDLAGAASCSVVVAQPSGPAPISATFAGDAFYKPASDSAAATISALSKLVYTGATTGDYHDPATISAKLTSALSGLPIASATVTLTLGAQSCVDATDAAGVASCSITPNTAAGPQPVTATFAGDASFDPSSDSATFAVTKEQTVTVYTGATAPVQNLTGLALSATLKEDGVTPIVGRSVTLTIGSGGSAQSCVDTTNAAGAASCSVVISQAAGSQPLSAAFAGDAFYLASADTASVEIYSAHSIKQDALDALIALNAANTCTKGKEGDDDCTKRFASPIRKITKSLNPAWWNIDGIHLTLNGCGVFDNEKAAASQLSELLKSKKLTAAQKAAIQAIIDQLVQADQILAQTAVDEATAAGGNAQKLARANKALAKAAALIAAGKPDEAINQYRIAWEKAQESLGRKVCGDDGHEDEDGHDGH